MTVESTEIKARYAGNGEATSFPVPFAFEEDEHVRAVVRSVAPEEDSGVLDQELTLDEDYSLSGAGTGLPGTLTYPLDGSPLPEGDFLTVYSDVPLTQERAWDNLDAIDTTEIEKADDKLTRLCQQLKEELDRCVKLPVAAPEPDEDIDPEELFAVRDAALAARDSALTSEANAAANARETAEDALTAAAAAANAAVLAESAAASENSAAASAALAESSALTAFGASAPAWDAATAYDFPDVVAGPDGHTWRALGPVSGVSPESSTLWVRLTLDTSTLFDQDADGDLILVA